MSRLYERAGKKFPSTVDELLKRAPPQEAFEALEEQYMHGQGMPEEEAHAAAKRRCKELGIPILE
jgi:hypothetical protein